MSDTPWDPFPDHGFLRDGEGQNVGRLQRDANGWDWLIDFTDFQPVGRYDPHTNQTWDVEGNLVGWGNQLAALLGRRRA